MVYVVAVGIFHLPAASRFKPDADQQLGRLRPSASFFCFFFFWGTASSGTRPAATVGPQHLPQDQVRGVDVDGLTFTIV